ncbi:hypothetical protein [Lutimonas sp.]|uniref:hypothetical protein n=1 Tax=Lutimonas sp. TaxID=1872403 RepID=UPI003D9B3F6C
MFKELIFLLLFTCVLTGQSQSLRTELITSSPLIADEFIGIDEFQSVYYITDNILYKKTDKKLFSYSNINAGDLTSVNIQNPFKVILFYANFNAAIILDNNLNELTQQIDFTKETKFNNVSLVSTASQNNIWLYADDNKLHLYDYQRLNELLQTQATTFYNSDFSVKNMVSTYKTVWVLSKKTVLEFNEYGIYTKSYPYENIEQIFPYQKGYIYQDKNQFYYQETNTLTPVSLEFNGNIKSVSVNSAFLFIFDGKSIYHFQIKR